LIAVKVRSTFAINLPGRWRSRFDSKNDLTFEVQPGTNVEEFLRMLPSFGPPESFDDLMLHVFVNGKLRGFDYILKTGDTIDLHIPVSGG
jgi:molybdopterin converting factor small subunit